MGDFKPPPPPGSGAGQVGRPRKKNDSNQGTFKIGKDPTPEGGHAASTFYFGQQLCVELTDPPTQKTKSFQRSVGFRNLKAMDEDDGVF